MEYPYVKAVDLPELKADLAQLGIAPLISSVVQTGTVLTITTSRTLTQPEEASLYEHVVSHRPKPHGFVQTEQRISAAIDFGRTILVEYSAGNVLRGLNTTDVSKLIAIMAPIVVMLMSGSLGTALLAIQGLKPDGRLITAEDVTYYSTKIKKFLSQL